MWCHHNRRTDRRVRRALAEQHEIARQVYRYAADGHRRCWMPRSRPCVATALTLYSEILDRIEDFDFAVFTPARHRRQRPTAARRRRRPVAFVAGPADAPGRSGRSQSRCGVMDRWQYLLVLGGLPGDHAAAGDLRPRRLPSSVAGRARRAAGRGGVRGLG